MVRGRKQPKMLPRLTLLLCFFQSLQSKANVLSTLSGPNYDTCPFAHGIVILHAHQYLPDSAGTYLGTDANFGVHAKVQCRVQRGMQRSPGKDT